MGVGQTGGDRETVRDRNKENDLGESRMGVGAEGG